MPILARKHLHPVVAMVSHDMLPDTSTSKPHGHSSWPSPLARCPNLHTKDPSTPPNTCTQSLPFVNHNAGARGSHGYAEWTFQLAIAAAALPKPVQKGTSAARNLQPFVAGVGHDYVARRIHGFAVWFIQLADARMPYFPLLHHINRCSR